MKKVLLLAAILTMVLLATTAITFAQAQPPFPIPNVDNPCVGQPLHASRQIFLANDTAGNPIWLYLMRTSGDSDSHFVTLFGLLEGDDGNLHKFQPAGSTMHQDPVTMGWRGVTVEVHQCLGSLWYTVTDTPEQ
jgi:hypothetical protein